MECKGVTYTEEQLQDANWNISRMECKEGTGGQINIDMDIGIYPEWNVKLKIQVYFFRVDFIGIYPEWNVKIKWT